MNSERVKSLELEMDQAGVRDIYDAMIANGQSPNMAAMLALQRPPGVSATEREFSKQENYRMKSMDDEQLEEIVDIAKKAGINTHGKTYNGALGRYNDPDAWVSGKDDVKKVAIKKGMDIDGMVKVNAYNPEKKKKIRLADDIVDRLEGVARASDKSLDAKCKKSDKARKDLRSRLIEKHSKPK